VLQLPVVLPARSGGAPRLPGRPAPDDDVVATSFPSHPATVAAARGVVAAALEAWRKPQLLDHALLVTSELVTNVVVHARTPLKLTLQDLSTALLVRVVDASSQPPVRRPHAVDDLAGRGLDVVDRLCLQWGTIVLGRTGKAVWALVDGTERPRSSRLGEAGVVVHA
jgi:anti-sigma regulatory factor (Ser/Thr protein kinase)